ncbi:MAG: S41 family peptidase [Candidatus Paceibacterota bacterium]|jgi:carboxyl-terminal processing protease
MKPLAKRLAMIAGATVIIAMAFFAGLYINSEKSALYAKITDSGSTAEDVDMRPFWKAWEILQSEYVPTGTVATTTVSEQDKVYGAIAGLAASLGDPYTSFLTPEEAKTFTTDLSGSLQGIGAVLGLEEGVLTVVSVIKESPAERAGLQAGDSIVKVDEKLTKDLDVDQAVQLIRGPKGTSVTLLIHRESRTDFPMTIVRDNITTPVVTTKQYPNGVFLITLASFTQNSPDLFRSALRDFVNSGSTKLIIDLRNNTGGYLDAAVDMASWFLPTGEIIVTEDYGKSADPMIYRSKGYNLFNRDLKVTLLVNAYTASASEILAGALRDSGKAIIVGEKTYGKGSVQELIPITPDTLLKVTVARWFTPKGTSISINGIIPDHVVELTEEDIKAKRDPQLDKALQVVGR